MKQPQPLFDTLNEFRKLDFDAYGLGNERLVVREYLEGFPPICQAIEGYVAVRSFLHDYCECDSTYSSYRTHAERLLLWSLLVAHKPLLRLQGYDAGHFIKFCTTPPSEWIGPVSRSRFLRVGGRVRRDSDIFVVNESWRPFNATTSKKEAKIASERGSAPPLPIYRVGQVTLSHSTAVCVSFYMHAIRSGLTEVNPFLSIKRELHLAQSGSRDGLDRSITSMQWLYIVETACLMANNDPNHERSLFIIATIYYLNLHVLDLVGRGVHIPVMGDICCDQHGAWWLHLYGSEGRERRTALHESYFNNYLVRYRRHLQLPPLPCAGETTPLVGTLRGRAGLSDRHVRLLIQEVLDRTVNRMLLEGWADEEVDRLRSASLEWLRSSTPSEWRV